VNMAATLLNAAPGAADATWMNGLPMLSTAV
jgi:hypothetical protein